MVGEFPELQGVIGGYYARAEGLGDAVADAIRDHYKPVGQGDEVPTAPVTVAVSLADKLDTVIAFFSASLKPSGSKDPFALRRAALAIISLLVENGLRLSLHETTSNAILEIDRSIRIDEHSDEMTDALEAISRMSPEVSNLEREAIENELRGYVQDKETGPSAEKIVVALFERTYPTILDFFADRLKVQQREAGIRHDLIDAVFALGGEDDLVRLLARVKALQAFVAAEDGVNLLAGYKRAANIVRIEAKKDAEGGAAPSARADGASYAPEPAEAALIAALDTAEPAAATAVAAEDFEGAMQALARLRPAVDAFFADVTVNDPDPIKRLCRLGLLDRIRVAVHNVADFSKIEG
jgi:glycyl-tRNA synthetase beta chain